MELWIRSQDGERLTKATDLRVYYASKENVYAIEDCDDLGYYKTKERALEVLDEIQNKIKQQFIVKSNILTSRKDIEREEKILKWKYDKEFIMQDNGFEITPINNNVFIYQLPVE